eukprot:TRINITY_DN7957_c0_g1_i4.p1 TRINITY_DN7957_c0_g1~~TRINITY_DN7957_c0_g1_i4.p1  ORF type:complete len:678 (+),score=170.46 TRINITY_DN7957_c0_g1_i4:242-2275(+)
MKGGGAREQIAVSTCHPTPDGAVQKPAGAMGAAEARHSGDGVLQRILNYCFGCIFRYIADPADTDLHAARKRRAIVSSFIFITLVLTTILVHKGSIYTTLGIILVAVPHTFQLAYVTCTKKTPIWLLEWVCYLLVLAILCFDMASRRAGSAAVWPFAIIALDACLVNELPSRVSRNALGMTCLWLALANAIEVTGYWGPDYLPDDFVPGICNCDDPPCKENVLTGVGHIVQDWAIVLVDFYLTRGFAAQVLSEKRTMQTAITTAENVAVCLSGFDLNAADDLLVAEERRLPKGLTKVFHNLLLNLRVYQPYLPKSCLPVDAVAMPEEETPPADDPPGSVRSSMTMQSTEDTAIGVMGSGTAGRLERAGRVERRTSSSDTATPERAASTALARAVQGSLTLIKSTLVVTNLQNSHSAIEDSPTAFTQKFSAALQMILVNAEVSRGIVDIFLGDRIFASFNASRHCPQHAASAVRALKATWQVAPTLLSDSLNAGVATGKVFCGDLGCADMRRFTIIGKLAMLCTGLERAGRMLGAPVVCSNISRLDVQFEHETRLIPQTLKLLKAPCLPDQPYPLDSCAHMMHEVVMCAAHGAPLPPTQRPSDLSVQEWMYEVEGLPSSWQSYNRAVNAYLNGATQVQAVDHIKGDAGLSEDVLQEHVALFDHMIRIVGSTGPLRIVF